MDQYKLSPYQIRLNEAKQRAQTQAKLARRSVPGALWEPALAPVTTRKLANEPKPAETAQKIKDELVPARFIQDVPEAPSSAISSTHINPYAGLKAGNKRKRSEIEASPPVKVEERLFISDGEDEIDRGKSSTNVGEEDVAPSNGTQKKAKAEPRPFAPPKRPATTKTTQRITQPVETRSTRNQQTWYEMIDMNQRYSRSDLTAMRYVMTLIKEIEVAFREGRDDKILFVKLRKRLHEMEFFDFVSGVLLRKSKVLDDDGLEAIFTNRHATYPWDIAADALLLYSKWRNGILDPHLLRGIDTKSGKDSKQHSFTSRNIDKSYLGRVSPNCIGSGKLVNGQWWPLQICALRDGAHGDIEGGISGMPGLGACSIVVSGGGYANIDEGTILKYCGTSGKNGEPSAGTKLLKESFDKENDIRVLRSASLNPKNPFRPSKGLRYDGLYKITSFEILDVETAMHRFRLRRCRGQDPIRYSGVEQRPTDQELAAYAKIKSLTGLSK